MTQEKQQNHEGPSTQNIECSADWAGKKINTDLLKWIIIGLAGFALIVLIFGAGVFVGGMKARFSYRWAESYHKNFAGPKDGFFGDWRKLPLPPGDFIEGHGTFGEIIKTEGNTLIVKGRENIEKVILVSEKTIIKSGRKDIKMSNLKIGDRIVIIGSPDEEGQIEAKLIRIFGPVRSKTAKPSAASTMRTSNGVDGEDIGARPRPRLFRP